jgi:hypothetical protein
MNLFNIDSNQAREAWTPQRITVADALRLGEQHP